MENSGAEKVEFFLKNDNQYTLVAKVLKGEVSKELSFLPKNCPSEGEAASLQGSSIEDAFCLASMTPIKEGETRFRCRWAHLILRKVIEFTGELIDK